MKKSHYITLLCLAASCSCKTSLKEQGDIPEEIAFDPEVTFKYEDLTSLDFNAQAKDTNVRRYLLGKYADKVEEYAHQDVDGRKKMIQEIVDIWNSRRGNESMTREETVVAYELIVLAFILRDQGKNPREMQVNDVIMKSDLAYVKVMDDYKALDSKRKKAKEEYMQYLAGKYADVTDEEINQRLLSFFAHELELSEEGFNDLFAVLTARNYHQYLRIPLDKERELSMALGELQNRRVAIENEYARLRDDETVSLKEIEKFQRRRNREFKKDLHP